MSEYNDNPAKALEVLEKIAEEISLGVSAENVTSIIPFVENNAEEIVNDLSRKFAEKLQSELRLFWNDFKIEEKLKEVKNLKTGNIKRQCLTPKDELNFFKAKFLQQRRTQLLEKLENIQEENKKLQQQLSDKSVVMRRQSHDIKSFDF